MRCGCSCPWANAFSSSSGACVESSCVPRRLTYFFDDEMAKWETLDLRFLRGKGKSHPKSTRPVKRGSRKSSPPPPPTRAPFQPTPWPRCGSSPELTKQQRREREVSSLRGHQTAVVLGRHGGLVPSTEYPVRSPQSPVTGGVRDPEKYSVDWMMIVPVPIAREGSAVDGRRGGEMAGWSGGVVEWWRGRKREEEEESGASREESGESRVESRGNSPRSGRD